MTRGFEVRGTDSRTPDGVQLDGRAGEYVGREVVAGLDRLRSSMEFPIYSLTCRWRACVRRRPRSSGGCWPGA